MKKFAIFFLLGVAIYSCCEIPRLNKEASVIENGGGNFDIQIFDLSDSVFSKLKPGNTFCYYQDQLI